MGLMRLEDDGGLMPVHRCGLVLQVLAGDALGPIEETLRNNEAS